MESAIVQVKKTSQVAPTSRIKKKSKRKNKKKLPLVQKKNFLASTRALWADSSASKSTYNIYLPYNLAVKKISVRS